MKNLDCNQINIFINFEIIEENKYKKILNLFFFKSKKFLQFGKVTKWNHVF